MGAGPSQSITPLTVQQTTDVIVENHVEQSSTKVKVLNKPIPHKEQNSVPNYIEHNSVHPPTEQNNVAPRRSRSSVATSGQHNDETEGEIESLSEVSPRQSDQQSLVSPRARFSQSDATPRVSDLQSTTPKDSQTLSEVSPRSRFSRTQSFSQTQSEASPRHSEPQSGGTSRLSRSQSLHSPRVTQPLIKPAPVEVTCGRYVPCLPKDSKDKKSKVTGCVYLSNGHLVLVDNRNKRVKLFDPDLKCNSFINLEHRPFEVCECKGTLYVTIPKEKEIQVISVSYPFLCIARKLILRSVIKTEGECYGITRHRNDLIVSMKFPPMPTDISDFSWQIQVLTTKGFVKQRITVDSKGRTLFTDAYFITMAVGKRELIVSEATCDRVKGYNMKNNKKTFNHKIEEPKGLVVDRNNNIYILGKHGSIHWIEPDRKHSHVLLEGTRGRKSSGENITYNTKTNKILVPKNENKVDIYNLRGKVS